MSHRRELLRSSHLRAMEVPRPLLMDAWSVARSLVRATRDALSQIQARPRAETAVKCSGGVVAALLALKYAKSLRSACVVGLLSGVFTHSLYADVIRKKPLVGAAGEQENDDAEVMKAATLDRLDLAEAVAVSSDDEHGESEDGGDKRPETR